MAEEFQERTEQATGRRRQQAREKGQSPKSPELTSMAGMGGMLLMFYFGGEYLFMSMATVTKQLLGLQYGMEPIHVTRIAVIHGAKILLPFFLISIPLIILASVMQGGIVMKKFELDFGKFNPVNGAKKFISMQGVMELLKSMLKFTVGIWIVYYVVRKDLKSLPMLSAMEFRSIVSVSFRIISNAVGIAFLYYLVIAVVTYFIAKWQFEKSIRMSKQEIKEEHKEMEGDPQIKSRIRSVQRETARKRMMQEVPTATVVITNPTHLAVALKYEDGKMLAPKIVAKGADLVAQKIKELAVEHNVPIVEDKPLARALFKIDLDRFVPEDLYVAVAKILAYIYKMKGRV